MKMDFKKHSYVPNQSTRKQSEPEISLKVQQQRVDYIFIIIGYFLISYACFLAGVYFQKVSSEAKYLSPQEVLTAKRGGMLFKRELRAASF